MNRHRAWLAAGFAAMAFAAMPVLAQPAVPEATDTDLLERDAQLADWLGEPLSPAMSVCLQARLDGAWPHPRNGELRDREMDRLRLLRESCAASSESDPARPQRGLVASARNDFIIRAARLSGLREAARRCAAAASGETQQRDCLARALGQPVTADLARHLIAATATPAAAPAGPP